MLTVMDLQEQFTIDGYVRIQRWDSETEDMDVLYEGLYGIDLSGLEDTSWMHKEIQYVYPSTSEMTVNDRVIELPQVVIEIAEEN